MRPMWTAIGIHAGSAAARNPQAKGSKYKGYRMDTNTFNAFSEYHYPGTGKWLRKHAQRQKV